jgi:hypothetical protein
MKNQIPTYEELLKMSRKNQKLIGRLSFSAGALIRGSIRKAIEKAIFNGYEVEYFEDKGLMNSIFTIKGNAEHVNSMAQQMEDCFY